MSADLADRIRLLASRLAAARSVAVLTGAGVSAESGLRTFRGVMAPGDEPAAGKRSTQTPLAERGGTHKDMAALWKEFDPATLATPEAFARGPAMVTRWYDWRRLGCLAAEPNPGHHALAELERLLTARSGSFSLLTQNVDRLHQRAGSRTVVELHGTIMVWRCTRTGRRYEPGPEPLPNFPMPSEAGGLLRPDVVWFGEMLPEEAITQAQLAAESADVFISIGTSSLVYPAAAFIHEAAANGAFTAEINAEETPISRHVDCSIRGRSGDVLPRVMEAIERL